MHPSTHPSIHRVGYSATATTFYMYVSLSALLLFAFASPLISWSLAAGSPSAVEQPRLARRLFVVVWPANIDEPMFFLSFFLSRSRCASPLAHDTPHPVTKPVAIKGGRMRGGSSRLSTWALVSPPDALSATSVGVVASP